MMFRFTVYCQYLVANYYTSHECAALEMFVALRGLMYALDWEIQKEIVVFGKPPLLLVARLSFYSF